MVKAGNEGNINNWLSNLVTSLNWLGANNVPRGTIVNLSIQLTNLNCALSWIYPPLDNAVKAAHNAGVIVVLAAGNDGCNTANYSPAQIPEAFVVGGTNRTLLASGKDAKHSMSGNTSRTGGNISAFAPGELVDVLNSGGSPEKATGTSLSAPYIAGIFAVACQTNPTFCNTAPTADIYNVLRGYGTLGTVTNTDGSPLTGATSRFIRQQW
ncbi:MAG: S8 family serine peptidase [Methylococcales bacterium]